MDIRLVCGRRWASFAVAGLALAALAGCGMREAAPARQLTVLLAESKGPAAAADMRRVGKELTDQGLPDVFVVEGAGQASLCVGRYPSWKDPQADAMLKRVRRVRTADGQYPFAGVMLVPVPEVTPATPWPLEKARGFYTLHVASWEAPGRMQAAQAFASELRRLGYEAYVYHGPRLSMATIGAFGPDIFDNPALVGHPGARPKVVSPKVLDLIQKFPRMRLEGEVAPPEAHVPTQLVQIPGREDAAMPGLAIPKVLYRVSLALVDTKTGTAEGRSVAAGVAQSRDEIPSLVVRLVGQILDALPTGKAVRIGVAGIQAADTTAARDRADSLVVESVEAAITQRGGLKATCVNYQTTQQLLDAGGLKSADVLRDPRVARGLQGLDGVITGSVISFSPR